MLRSSARAGSNYGGGVTPTRCTRVKSVRSRGTDLCPRNAVRPRGYADEAMTKRLSISLTAAAPELVGQFHESLNGQVSFDQLSPGMHMKVWWKCERGHVWEAAVYSQVAGIGCPFCGQRKVGYGNDLATCVPEVAMEWHPTKNLPLTPDQVLPQSNRRVWWLGLCGHEWESIISNRTKDFRPGGPYCANQRVGYGNDLASRHPEIAAEWHPTKNRDLLPHQVTDGAPA